MNQIGQQFRLSIFGESHGPKVGVSIDGIPPGIALDVEDFSNDLQRRRTGGTGTSTNLKAINLKSYPAILMDLQQEPL